MMETAAKTKPEISLEWKDLRIEAKILDDRIDSESRTFVDVFPEVSPDLLCQKTISKVSKEQAERRLQASFTLTNHLLNSDYINEKKAASPPRSTPRNLKCHICGRIFNKMTYLKRHILSHSSVKPFKCKICGWGFYQQSNLKRHMASHTNSSQGFRCTHCRATFTTKSVLSVHMRDAHGNKFPGNPPPAAEPSRPPSVSRQSTPKAMKQSRPPVKPADPSTSARPEVLSNDALPKGVPKLSNQVSLIRIREKPYKCNVCGWRFTQLSNLKKHQVTHTQGGHPCPYCGVEFTTKIALSMHVNQVHAVPQSEEPDDFEIDDDEEDEIPAPI